MITFANFASILQSYITGDDWERVKDLPISGVVSDSRAVKSGEVFALLSINPDTKHQAKNYIDGINPVAVLSEISSNDMGYDDQNLPKMPIVHIANLRLILGDFIKAYLHKKQPVSSPKILAVTGTNGKTTISQLTAQLGELSCKPSAIMGTAGNGRLGHLVQSTHTTSEVIKVHEFLHTMGADGVQMVALEASSHGLHQHRLQGVGVSVGVFSNLSRDHLDYHADMDEYGSAKARLFDTSYFKELSHAIINIDDTFGRQLAQDLQGSNLPDGDLTVWTYSTADSTATFFADNISPSLHGVRFELHSPFGVVELNSPLLGRFNVGNLLASVASLLALYPDDFANLSAIVPKLHGARGRMQVVGTSKAGAVFIVDYAHTPDALTQVLTSLKAHTDGKLWAVFGCGGDRDKGKRPLMAKAGLDLADRVILTSDNPRSENPNAILNDMQAGMTCDEHYRTIIEPDRKQAIQYAVQHAKAGDIVVIAGKGHETYQEINGVRYDFDDVAVVQELIN
ncbi:MAG: UDP-N-acetylmuramoyl-L-alanyl-D-glutamate--2,6-diaminopimelate ligase [Moraxella sp.]|nr:UDP-N-acetylmuramoyl-L-alanyl-D-glutamate--2,6-diaminopimelate ligase [Moraxella sp.]